MRTKIYICFAPAFFLLMLFSYKNAIAQNTFPSKKIAVIVKSKNWSLTGNAGTSPGINFLGTTDAQPLLFKVKNNKSGYIDFDAAKANTGFGYQTLFSNPTGYLNTANGYKALFSDTFGSYNTANGSYALYTNTVGFTNTADGAYALYANTTGEDNTANGFLALFSNTIGHENTANGASALYRNTTGYWNTANGNHALYRNTTGIGNTADGIQALPVNTTGSYNTAIGNVALVSNKDGSYNTALGFNADVKKGFLVNASAIGYNAIVDASNKVRIGNTDVTSIGGQVGWSTFSDGRYKKNIKEDVKGLSFINSLHPITYTVDINSLDAYYDKGRMYDSAYEKIKAAGVQPPADEASKIVYNGFIAQDVEKAAQSIDYNFSGVDKPQTKDGLYGLRYADFVVPLVKAVQELSKINDEKDALIQQQQLQLNDVMARLNKLEKIAGITNTQLSSVNTDKQFASLEQNIPNPFNGSCTINYNIISDFKNAQLLISDISGHVLKTYSITQKGYGKQIITNNELSSGTYQYSLLIDGKLIDTKKMVSAK